MVQKWREDVDDGKPVQLDLSQFIPLTRGSFLRGQFEVASKMAAIPSSILKKIDWFNKKGGFVKYFASVFATNELKLQYII